MGKHARPRDRRGHVAATVTAGLTVCGVTLIVLGATGAADSPPQPPPQPPPRATASTNPASPTSGGATATPATPSATANQPNANRSNANRSTADPDGARASPDGSAGPRAISNEALLRPAASVPSYPSPVPPNHPSNRPPRPSHPPTSASQQAEAVSLRIPKIDLHTEKLLRLGLTENGALEVPSDAHTAGWYVRSPVPGRAGPAVIAGHVDSTTGPGVFYRLGALRRGDEVTVDRTDGQRVHFTVYAVAAYPKTDFPTEEVYGETTRPELRLITCGGDFDSTAGHYRSNVVVFARGP